MTYNQTIGNYPLGLHYATESGKLVNKISNLTDSIRTFYNYNLTFSYGYLHNKELALKNLVERWPISKRVKPGFVDGNIGKAFYILEEYDSATKYNRLVVEFFNKEFPDAVELMPNLATEFFENPTAPLGTIKCYPWQYKGKNMLLGDAAHAIVPFYGQGMNASFEDVVEFDAFLDAHTGDWEKTFNAFLTGNKRSR